jgi:hypothetical protein
MYFILDKNHNLIPASLKEWSEWFNDVDNRRVGATSVGEYWVSTVCLGTGHLFETMVFKDDKEVYCEHYTTWNEAVAGHKRIMESYREQIHTTNAR